MSGQLEYSEDNLERNVLQTFGITLAHVRRRKRYHDEAE